MMIFDVTKYQFLHYISDVLWVTFQTSMSSSETPEQQLQYEPYWSVPTSLVPT